MSLTELEWKRVSATACYYQKKTLQDKNKFDNKLRDKGIKVLKKSRCWGKRAEQKERDQQQRKGQLELVGAFAAQIGQVHV